MAHAATTLNDTSQSGVEDGSAVAHRKYRAIIGGEESNKAEQTEAQNLSKRVGVE